MSIVNVKVQNIRPAFLNLKDWCSDSNNIYIGRKGIVFIDNKRYPTYDSIWFNPFKIGKDGNRNEVIQKYEVYIRDRLKNGLFLKDELRLLKNKNLGCWCAPELCHGNVLLKILQEENVVE